MAALAEVAISIGIRLVSLDPDVRDWILAEYPFYRPVTIPAGTYRGQDAPVETLGMDNVFLCREDLDEALVYQLTKLFVESLSDLAGIHAVVRQITAERMAGTSIPLHPGAARYYRERELFR